MVATTASTTRTPITVTRHNAETPECVNYLRNMCNTTASMFRLLGG